jgi:purine-nucleoside phosphorylase
MTGIVLGSGLGPLAEAVRVEEEVSFERAGLPVSAVPGHHGKFIVGKLGDEPVVLMSGRVHLYEGHDPRAVTEGVAWLAARGVSRIVLTNAAGTLNPDFAPGSWMVFSDHLNLTGTSPLIGAEFIDMSAAYDPAWRNQFADAAAETGITLHRGVYAGLRGPQYETPAEIRMLSALGADAVGMSTVLETIRARSLGLTVAAFSCLTNWASGISPAPLNHGEVIATGKKAARDMIRLLEKTVGGL